ncbi:MAG: PAS domain S-box protein [Thermodesulfobacteriota bacterium]|nr:PAS domain S-box protein [Thermodesulfobacteriota bacterium]
MKRVDQVTQSLAKRFTKDYLFVSLIPVLLLLAFTVSGAFLIENHTSDLIRRSIDDLNENAEKELELLGQKIIRAKARDVAKQTAIFLNANPGLTMKALQKSQYFKNFTMQKVGETGYTCLYESGTGIMRIHPNPSFIDFDMQLLAEKLPSWWAIFEPTLSGKEVSGYYDWLEADQTLRRKYMTMTPVHEAFSGQTLMIAATTYIDEFSTPIASMKDKANKIRAHYQNFIFRQGVIISLALAVFLLFIFTCVYLLGRRSGLRYILPIEQLARAAKNLGKGKWEAGEYVVLLQRKDEIGELAKAFNNMQTQLRNLFFRLEQRLAELKLTQKALKQSEEHYRSLFDGVPVGLYRTTPDGNILDSNPTLVKILGYPDRQTFLGRNAQDLYVHPEDRNRWKMQIETQQSSEGFEIQMRQYNGTVIWVENFSRIVRNADGGILYYEGSLIDVTERKKLEAQLQYAQRMESIGTLAGGIAHDFNNLMMGIQGNISLLLFDIDRSFPHYKKLKNIEESIKSGARLTSQLLGYARKGKYEVRRLALNQIVAASAETFGRTRKEITINLRPVSDLHEIEADRTQIEQVLFNLFINAADAMPGKGDLSLKTMNVSRNDMVNKPYKPAAANYVMLQVTDTGEGMDTKTLERIFDPFFTTKGLGRGTGLGLASVYGIIKAHGGYIDVESEQGVGTTFYLYFPALDKTDSHTHISDEGPARVKPGKGMILLVDDEEIIMDVSTDMLEKLGYGVLKAVSGNKAIAAYQANSVEIDLVILDLIMPKMSGGEVYDKLKKINPQVKVLLSSGYSIDGQATEILGRGCNGFIQKPFNMEELSMKVNKILDSKKGG